MNGRNRRRKDVPFNPFAQNAAAERNRRHAEKAKEKRRQEAQNQATSGLSNSATETTSPRFPKSLTTRHTTKLYIWGGGGLGGLGLGAPGLHGPSGGPEKPPSSTA